MQHPNHLRNIMGCPVCHCDDLRIAKDYRGVLTDRLECVRCSLSYDPDSGHYEIGHRYRAWQQQVQDSRIAVNNQYAQQQLASQYQSQADQMSPAARLGMLSEMMNAGMISNSGLADAVAEVEQLAQRTKPPSFFKKLFGL